MADRTGDSTQRGRAVFGQTVRMIRESQGLSQEHLADLAGIHRTYVSSLERGQRNVGLDNILLIARALKVAPARLFEEF